jgi:tetratricopeptide (TPR) repeat protein
VKRNRCLFLAALALLTALVYLPVLKSALIWDSRPMILENDLLKRDASPAAPFRSGYWAATSQRQDLEYDYYRPLTTLSFMMEKAAWGLSPFRLRLANLMIFITGLLILTLFLHRQGAPPGVAETAAVLYALFPLHLDNINWVVGRCDLLMLLFGLFSLLLFDHFLEKRDPLPGLLALLSFALALFSKEAALFFLPLFPLHELMRRRRISLLLYIPPLLVTAAFWLLKSAAIGLAGFPLRPFPTLWENVQAVLGALGYYARSLVFPFAYDMFLPLDAVQTLPCLAAGMLLALFLALAPVLGRRQAGIAGAWFWIAPFLGGALLMIFTPIYPFSISTRYLVVPAIGWTWLLAHWLAALPPSARKAVSVILIVASAAAISIHSQKYRSETAFWESAVRSCPNNSFFLSKYAGQLREDGDPLGGEALLRRALTFKLSSSTASSIALQLADAALAKGRYEEGLDWLEKVRALPLSPPRAERRLDLLLRIHRARNDLSAAEGVLGELAGVWPAERTRTRQAELYLAFAEWEKARAAARLFPPPLDVQWSQIIQKTESDFRSMEPGQRARFFIQRGNFALAWEHWPAKDAPGIPEQLRTIRLAFLAGRETEGERRLELLARRQGADFRLLNAAGSLLFDLQRADEALPFYERSLMMNPEQPALRDRVERIKRSLRPFPPL